MILMDYSSRRSFIQALISAFGAGTAVAQIPAPEVPDYAFTLANAPTSLSLFSNGRLLDQGRDYTLIGATVTLHISRTVSGSSPTERT